MATTAVRSWRWFQWRINKVGLLVDWDNACYYEVAAEKNFYKVKDCGAKGCVLMDVTKKAADQKLRGFDWSEFMKDATIEAYSFDVPSGYTSLQENIVDGNKTALLFTGGTPGAPMETIVGWVTLSDGRKDHATMTVYTKP